MPPTRQDLLLTVHAAFATEKAEPVLAVLDRYGVESYERERERVQMAIVELSGGSEDRLRELVQAAKTDYRDILAWKQLGPLSEAEGERLQTQAKALLRDWGKP